MQYPPRFRPLSRKFLFSIAFVLSLTVCLVLGQLSWRDGRFQLGVGVAQTAQQTANQAVNQAAQQVQQGVLDYQAANYQAAIAHWQSALETYQVNRDLSSQAIVLENLARVHQVTGQSGLELGYWQQATEVYRQLHDRPQVGRMLTEQAQTYSRQGQYRNAIILLCHTAEPQPCADGSALQIARDTGDLLGEVAALGSLGDAYRLQGNYQQAIEYLQAGLTIARQPEYSTYLIPTLNSLGNSYLSLAQTNYRRAVSSEQIEEYAEADSFRTQGQGDDRAALVLLQESQMLADTQADRVGQLRSLLSAIPAYYRTEAQAEGEATLQQALQLWGDVPTSQEKVYAAITLAQILQSTRDADISFSRRQCFRRVIQPQAKQLLEQATSLAETLEDARSLSFAWGELGHLYECSRDYDTALDLTRRAQVAADQALSARDSLYLWQWQAGRLFTSQHQTADALRAYQEATATLKLIQDDIVIANREVRFDFRDTIEPIYRGLVKLQLDQEQPSTLIASEQRETPIDQALITLDDLKLAELQNYFGNDCVLVAFTPERLTVSSPDPQAAIFSTVLLDDRAAVVMNFRDSQQQLQQQLEWIRDDQDRYIHPDRLVEQINQYRQGLERVRDAAAGLAGYDLGLSQQLYDWVVRPFAEILESQEIQTLVFVQDGIFRSIPMTALHDGNQFLIENYAIATTPSLNLTSFEPLQVRSLRALAVGLTERTTVDGRAFPGLTYVNSEIQAVKATLPDSIELLNQEFTRDRMQQALDAEAFPIIHIATHGRFSAEAEDAFLVTGATVDRSQKLTINDLDDIIRDASLDSPVELLVLSACQTAAGDDRAALGLAGIAAQAGAKSVLASLWSVNDQSTAELIAQFYENLIQAEMPKAQALQAAQKALLAAGGRTAHPAYWSAFILIGNWL